LVFKKISHIFGGDAHQKKIESFKGIVDAINSREPAYEALSNEALKGKTKEFKDRLADGESLDDLLVDAFAAVREASKRTLGQRHYDVQLITGITLHRGEISEMKTGEGKTLAATLPIYLNALTEKGVHLVTVNDYLARRDGRWMGKIFRALDMDVGILQAASRTGSGKKGYIYDPTLHSSAEVNDQIRLVDRKESYAADITYGTNNEFGFDYLRDNLAMAIEDRVQRGHYFAIIDEVDSVLIDSARTPLIISGPAYDDTERYQEMNRVVEALQPEDYEINEKDRTVSLTEIGIMHAESLLGRLLRNPEDPEAYTYEQARDLGFLEQALRAHFLFHRNKDYVVQRNAVIIVDEFTGRMMQGRRWSDGLHQAIEAKENVNIKSENITHATITIQNYFRMYKKLAGMTGTALTEKEEFFRIYGLDVLRIPTNLDYRTMSDTPEYIKEETRDEAGYTYRYYHLPEDKSKTPYFWERQDYPDIIYRTKEAKLRAIVREIIRIHVIGRPQLVGTASVESSELLSGRLKANQVYRLMEVLLIRSAYLQQYGLYEDSPGEKAELEYLYQPLDTLQNTPLRNLGRQFGLTSMNPLNEENILELLRIMQLEPEQRERLEAVIQGGIPHQVLNARHHTEESQIIARAGEFGSVTIATNMAGRGVDIKLGGELPDALIENINRVLRNAKYPDVYKPDFVQWAEEIERLSRVEGGIQVGLIEDAKQFVEKIAEMEKVRNLGGLHVIGTERHEARRIDNQLRGRAARQGDPGSSRFYLSTEDDLMRLFGGAQLEVMLSRLKIDEAMPIESGLIGRIVEDSQKRVEGANFDVRKHLLEYDDVLNTQRERIYSQRDRVFEKEDLRGDVSEMFQSELQSRITANLEANDRYRRILAYLDTIQPTIYSPRVVYPSFSLKLIIDSLGEFESPAVLKKKLLQLAADAMNAWYGHFEASISELYQNMKDAYESQIAQKMESMDIILENLDHSQPDAKSEFIRQTAELIGVQLSPSDQLWGAFEEDPDHFEEELRSRVRQVFLVIALRRLVMTVEKRAGEEMDLGQTPPDWESLKEKLDNWLEDIREQRIEKLLGSNGEIARDLDQNGRLIEEAVDDPGALVRLLFLMTQGKVISFDKDTKKRVQKRVKRLTYLPLAEDLLQQRGDDTEKVAADIMSHLSVAQEQTSRYLGWLEFEQMRVGDHKLGLLPEEGQNKIVEKVGSEDFGRLKDLPLNQMTEEDQKTLVEVLGRNAQNRFYRFLLLSTVSQLWRSYLTEVEGLRVAVRMESYGQQDPLVVYKSRASEQFTNLLSNIRVNVVDRMFKVRLIDDADMRKLRPGLIEQESPQGDSKPAEKKSKKKKSRKRH
jgi:preprotein translocase subunit SecA